MRGDSECESDPGARGLSVVNLSWCVVPLGALVSAITAVGFLWTANENELSVQFYREAIVVQCGAAFVELCSEPVFIAAQNSLAVGVRATIEALAVAVRALLTYVLICYAELRLLSFAYAQFAYALVLLVGYWSYAAHRRSLPLPRWPRGGQPFVRRELLGLALTFAGQSVEKLLLTEGEKVSRLCSVDSYFVDCVPCRHSSTSPACRH